MSLVSRQIGDRAQTKQWMKKAKSYSGYLSEGLVGYRCEQIKFELKEMKAAAQHCSAHNYDD